MFNCAPGYYLESGECKRCIDPCFTCSLGYDCTSCLFRYRLIDNYCELTDCPEGTYEDNFICEPCSEACLTCYGPSNSDCIECNFQEGYMIDNSGKCYPRVCTDGTYLEIRRAQCSICKGLCKSCDDKNSCVECVSEAPNSIVNDETICSLCPDGYNYKLNKCTGNS